MSFSRFQIRLLGITVLLVVGVAWGQAKLPALPPPNLGGGPAPAPAATPQVPVSPGEMPVVTISARVEQTEVRVGEPFRFIVTVSWEKKPAGQTAELDFNFPDPPKSEGIRVVGNSFKAGATVDQGRTRVVREYSYEMAAEKEGKLGLGETLVVYRRRGSAAEEKLSTHPLEISAGPARRHFRELLNPGWAKLMVAGVLALALAGLAALVIRERRKKAEPAPEPTQSLEDRCLRQLQDNETLRIAGRYPDYFLGLSAILKGYLHERLGIRTQGQTSDKIAEAMRARTDQEKADAVRNTLHLCDRVKFAGHQPGPSEMDRAYEVVRSLLASGLKDETESSGDASASPGTVHQRQGGNR